jgi:DNA polymerase-1
VNWLVGRPDLQNAALIDHNVIGFTRSCQNNGLCIDREHFWNLSDFLQQEIDYLAKQITEYIPKADLDSFTEESTRESLKEPDELNLDDFNPDSPDQIATLLFKHLKIGEGMELTTTPTGDRISTGKKQLQRLKDEHPIIPLILQRREYYKLKHTYANILPTKAIYDPKWDRWRIYYTIGLTFTSTGRMNCSRLHQIPGRTDIGKLIKEGFMAYPGRVLLSLEKTMMDIFWNNGDIHQVTQDGLPIPADFNNEMKRIIAKATNFGTAYSVTDLGLWLALVAA